MCNYCSSGEPCPIHERTVPTKYVELFVLVDGRPRAIGLLPWTRTTRRIVKRADVDARMWLYPIPTTEKPVRSDR
jgi:hypothetical protein